MVQKAFQLVPADRIVGSSGAGKSTVLNILGGMDSNDSGKVIIDGKDISKYSRTQLTA